MAKDFFENAYEKTQKDTYAKQIEIKLKKGKNVEEIAEEVELDIHMVQALIEEYNFIEKLENEGIGISDKILVDLRENELEDEELSDNFQDRLNLLESEWIELPPEKSIVEHYKEKKKDINNKRK